MRILHFIGRYLPETVGGTQLQLRALATWQRLHGHLPTVLCGTGLTDLDPGEVAATDQDGIRVARFRRKAAPLEAFSELYRPRDVDRAFRRWIDCDPPDLVHIHHLSGLSTAAVGVAADAGLPVVMWLSDLWLQCLRGQRFHPGTRTICETIDHRRCAECLQPLFPDFFPPGERVAPPPRGLGDPEAGSIRRLRTWEAEVRRAAERCSALLVPSEFQRQRFIEWGLPAERLHVVEYGLDPGATPAADGWRRPVRRIGFTGLVLPSKGVHVLVEAFNLLDRRELSLEIYGDTPPFHEEWSYREELMSRVRRGLTVRFHGRYEERDLPQVLAGLDILVVPSLWWESYCLTAREGVLAGLPVVTFGLGGLGAMVERGAALGIAEPSPEALAAGLERICDDTALRRRLAGAGRECVPSVDHSSRAVQRVYDAVLKPATTPASRPVRPHRATARLEAAATQRPAGRRPEAGRGPEHASCTVVIPTRDPGEEAFEALAAVLGQRRVGRLKVLVIDSGSPAGAVARLRALPLRMVEIPPEEFNHGATRRMGVRLAETEYVAFLSQDALPGDDLWLHHLLVPFADPEVAGSFSRQEPRPGASPLVAWRLDQWVAAAPSDRQCQLEDASSLDSLSPIERLRYVAFDNVSSCVRRRAALEIPFRNCRIGEDIDWGARVLRAGHALVFASRSRVVHSHDRSLLFELRRSYLDHQHLNRLVGLRSFARWPEAVGAAWEARGHLWRLVSASGSRTPARISGYAQALAQTLASNLGQHLGCRSAKWLADGRRWAGWVDRCLAGDVAAKRADTR